MSWSVQQQQAIEIRGKNILVAAAAGSGKTSVLVERIIRRITDPQHPLDVDRLLVVTFTNAAAAEMRSRIGSALEGELKKSIRSRHLERQLVLLNSASISTIHAFCQSVVRQYFHLLDIDPKFRIAGEAELTLLKAEILDTMFEAYYARQHPAFTAFVERYGQDRDHSNVYQLIMQLYDFSRSHPWPSHWLTQLSTAFTPGENADIDQTPWAPIIVQKASLEISQAIDRLAALAREAEQASGMDAYAEVLAADGAMLAECAADAGQSWQAMAQALGGLTFARLPAVKQVDPDVKKYLQEERDAVKARVRSLHKQYFLRTPAEWLTDMADTAPSVDMLAQLTLAFGDAYTAAKQAKGLADFSDLEHYCLAILRDPDSPPGVLQPSTAARELREKFQEIMVDEYQDTNGVQEAIVMLLAAPERPGLFFVGDVKQSIYRFRLAEPALFMDKYRRYPAAGEQYARIDLSQNFRSRAGILDAVNFFFSQLMSPAITGLDYGEAERLNAGPAYPETNALTLAGPLELCLLDRAEAAEATVADDDDESLAAEDNEETELHSFVWEARLIAKRIIAFMAEQRQVYDKKTNAYRPLAWRDMVILLRSVKSKAGMLLDELREYGIPAYAEVDGGYFRETEIQVMLSLLSVIDNPLQDIPLAGVLRSPLVGLGSEELAAVRLASPDEDLWRAVVTYAERCDTTASANLCQRLQRFMAQLDSWRSFSRRKGVPDLIWQIYRDTGYYDYVGGMPGGVLRQANLRALYDRARQYEATNFRGLFRFLRFIERMQDKGSDLSVARALSENEDVVRVMSIHKSKGLEFPLVFVADLGKAINLQDSKGPVLFHKTLGIGPYAFHQHLRYRYPTLARHAIAHTLNMETKAEELRILYVALTRAREKLILVGSVAKLAAKARLWCQSVGREELLLPDSCIAGANSYLDWICPAVARHRDGDALRQLAGCTDLPCGQSAADPVAIALQLFSQQQLGSSRQEAAQPASLLHSVKQLQPVAVPADSTTVSTDIAAALSWTYPMASVLGKPAKLSVTEIKRRFELPEHERGQVTVVQPAVSGHVRPRFLQEQRRITAAERGTIMHAVMQYMDYRADTSAAGIAQQLADLVSRDLLLPEQAAVVQAAQIADFFASPLGQRMQQAAKVRRELSFSLLLPAETFYPDMPADTERIFVQGVVDVLFAEADGWVLVDYKTDRGKSEAELAALYRVQLALYAQAVERILQQPVKEKYIYAFEGSRVVSIGD